MDALPWFNIIRKQNGAPLFFAIMSLKEQRESWNEKKMTAWMDGLPYEFGTFQPSLEQLVAASGITRTRPKMNAPTSTTSTTRPITSSSSSSNIKKRPAIIHSDVEAPQVTHAKKARMTAHQGI